jgi:hypothetical protein
MLAPVLTKIEKIAIPNFWLNFSRRNWILYHWGYPESISRCTRYLLSSNVK